VESEKFFEVEKVSRPQKVAIWRLVLLLGLLVWMSWLLFLRLVCAQMAGSYTGYISGLMDEKMALEFQLHQVGRELQASGEVSRCRGTQIIVRKFVLVGAVTGDHCSLEGALGSGTIRFEGDLLKDGEISGLVRFIQTGDAYDTCGFVLKPAK